MSSTTSQHGLKRLTMTVAVTINAYLHATARGSIYVVIFLHSYQLKLSQLSAHSSNSFIGFTWGVYKNQTKYSPRLEGPSLPISIIYHYLQHSQCFLNDIVFIRSGVLRTLYTSTLSHCPCSEEATTRTGVGHTSEDAVSGPFECRSRKRTSISSTRRCSSLPALWLMYCDSCSDRFLQHVATMACASCAPSQPSSVALCACEMEFVHTV